MIAIPDRTVQALVQKCPLFSTKRVTSHHSLAGMCKWTLRNDTHYINDQCNEGLLNIAYKYEARQAGSSVIHKPSDIEEVPPSVGIIPFLCYWYMKLPVSSLKFLYWFLYLCASYCIIKYWAALPCCIISRGREGKVTYTPSVPVWGLPEP